MRSENKLALFSSPLLRLEVVGCQRALRGLSCEECKTEHQLTIPLSGINLRQVNGQDYAISPSHMTLSNRGEPYRIGHPYGSGETQLNIVLQEGLLLELLCAIDPAIENHSERPFAAHQLPISTQDHLIVQTLMSAARSSQSSELELDETTIALVAHLLGDGVNLRNALIGSRADRELAQQAQAMLASCYSAPIALQGIASTLGVSVYHLCRVFKRTTQRTLWSRIQELRIRAALMQLASGARDLTTLGLALGYSHHSHFTAAFRREVGLTPSAARRLLANGSLAQVRTLLAH